MNGWKVTIAGSVGLIAACGVAFAAVRASSAPWAGGLTSATFFLLITSLLGIAFGRGRRRAFWAGFALLGWSHLLIGMVPWLDERIGSFLLAPSIAEELFDRLHAEGGEATAAIRSFMAVALHGKSGGPRRFPPGPGVSPEALEQILRMLEALLWAVLGGLAARSFRSLSERPGEPAAPVGSPPAGSP